MSGGESGGAAPGTVSLLPVRGVDLRAGCADVLHAMLLGGYGGRVREAARDAAGTAWNVGRLDDAPAILTEVLGLLGQRMHPIHVGTVSRRVLAQLIAPGSELEMPAFDEPGIGEQS